MKFSMITHKLTVEMGSLRATNQIKSSGLGIALDSFIQSGVLIPCVLRFFSPDLQNIVISVTLARLEIFYFEIFNFLQVLVFCCFYIYQWIFFADPDHVADPMDPDTMQ